MAPSLQDIIQAVVVIVVAIVAAGFSGRALTVLAKRLDRDESALADDLLRALRLPVAMLVLLAGIYLALTQLESFRRVAGGYSQVFQVASVVVILCALTNAINLAILWYSRRMVDDTYQSHLSLLKKLVVLALWVLGSIQALSMLGVRVTAVLASLGVAGLAVGLALQDTIANLFAGFYMLADRSVRAGDYIKLESGEEGFVELVGWRNTRIRLWANNVVLIPNSKLTQSTIVNMALPNSSLSVYTKCSVSYDSDLEHVEAVALDVANSVLRTHPGGDMSYNPVVRFKEFGESTIKFTTVFRASEVGAQYLLQHEFIKALHKRFAAEHIDISSPIRSVIWDKGASPTSNGNLPNEVLAAEIERPR